MAKGDIITIEELKNRHSGYFANAAQPSDVAEPEADTDGALLNFGQGLLKSVGKTAKRTGELGRNLLQKPASRAVDAVFGTDGFGVTSNNVFDQGSSVSDKAEDLIAADTRGEKIGSFIGDAAQFAIPANSASKATAGASMLTRAAGQGAAAGIAEVAQTGDIDRSTLNTALFGAAMVPAGDALKAASTNLSQKLPEWLVRPLVKQTKTAKEQGKDIVPFMLEKGRVGSTDSLIQQSDDAMRSFGSQIDDVLSKSDQSINLRTVAEEVAERINTSGGATTADDILNVVQKQAFKARGTIANSAATGDDLIIAKANGVRSQLDEALYQGKDYLRNVPPENKALLEEFTNTLRNRVQTLEPTTAPLFSQYSKEITLKKALVSRATVADGGNSLGLLDLLIGAGAFGATGNPLAGVAGAGARQAFESATVKTALARAFGSTEAGMQALSQASPAIQGLILELISENDPPKERTEEQSQ